MTTKRSNFPASRAVQAVHTVLAALALFLMVLPQPAALSETWPDFQFSPSPSPGEGLSTASSDAALVVGIEDYVFAPDIPGAKQNAGDWWRYFRSQNIPFENTQLLSNHEGTREGILRAAQKAAEKVQTGGTLWFVFIGHGLSSMDGESGLLVGSDAQQNPQSLESRSVRQNELDDIFSRSKASRIVIILDACFSGRTSRGDMLIPGLQPLMRPAQMAMGGRIVRLTAAASDEYAGPLPFGNRPAFSYLLLGALRGWADANLDKNVEANEAVAYVRNVLHVLEKGRTQTPELLAAAGNERTILAANAVETGPNLDAILLSSNGSNNNTESEINAINTTNTTQIADNDNAESERVNNDNVQKKTAALAESGNNSPAAAQSHPASRSEKSKSDSSEKSGKKTFLGIGSIAAGGAFLAGGTYLIVQYAKEPRVYDTRAGEYAGSNSSRNTWKLLGGSALDLVGIALVVSGIVVLSSSASDKGEASAAVQNQTISDVSLAVMPTAGGLNASVGFKF